MVVSQVASMVEEGWEALDLIVLYRSVNRRDTAVLHSPLHPQVRKKVNQKIMQMQQTKEGQVIITHVLACKAC